MHKHLRAMDFVKVEHVVFQDLQIEIDIHFFVVWEKVQISLLFYHEKHPHTITKCKCLTIGSVYRESK